MLSTSSKVAFGYILLIALLLGTLGYIFQQITLLTETTGMEHRINNRRHSTHYLISKLYEAEIIGQALHVGKLNEYPRYKKAMREVGIAIDSLQTQLKDTLQQTRLDTLRTLIRSKEKNMMLVLEAMRKMPTDELYKQQLDSLILQQDSILRNSTHLHRRIVTHQNTYTIHHKKKAFFKRVKDVFAPGKTDSTLVNNIIKEEYTDTIEEAFSPVDTIASMLTGIHDKVFQTRQEHQRMLNNRTNRLHIAGSNLSKRVNQLLESIEQDDIAASQLKLQQEQDIRHQAARTMGLIATAGVFLVLVFFAIIWRDLTRSNHYRRELEKSKLYAENLLAAREKLMLTITHDIKAPAGSIIGYIDLLIRLTQDKRQNFYLTNMKSSAQHLLNLVTSLLDFHRLEAGKMDLHPVAFNPAQLFDDIYNSFLPLAEKKDLELYLKSEIPHSLHLEGDPFRIRQIAENLLSNALKFTASGSITLTINYRSSSFLFSVSDTGCGITLQEQERIFKEFTRLQNAQGQEGFGLGLSITHKLVELLNGNIQIESQPKKGSTFSVSIPLPAVCSHQTASEENKETVSITTSNPLRILLIDDDRIQMNLTETLLKNLIAPRDSIIPTVKPEIFCCEQPEEVFNLLQQHPFDVIFTDIQMPAMNGFELLQNLRYMNLPQAKNIPVIAITARGDLSEADFCEKGFSGMLQKPFNLSDLRRILSDALRNKVENRPFTLPAPALREKPLNTAEKYDFSSLTAFSEDDPEAAKEIIRTFLAETQKNVIQIKEALSQKEMKALCGIAHKMLPTFTMINAHEALPSLQYLENKRDENILTEEAEAHARKIIEMAENMIQKSQENAM